MLREVDLVAAEDTRRTRKLLSHYDIHRPLISFNQANEKKALPGLMAKLKQGSKIALVSDAGTPGIADPGHSLVKACLEAGVDYELLPGPSAVVSAAVISGLPTHDLRFLGFLPRRQSQRRRLLAKLADQPSTLIFYESPRRIASSLADIGSVLGDRQLVVIREMTKKFEERRRGAAAELSAVYGEQPPKGEIVLLIEGTAVKEENVSPETLETELSELLRRGYSKSAAAKTLAEKYRLPRRRVYDLALTIKKW